MLVQVLVLAAVEPPPQLPAHGVAPSATPIKHAHVEGLLGIAPEEDVVNVEIAVAPRNVVGVAIAPPRGLGGVRVDGAQHPPVRLHELRGGALCGEEGLGRALDELAAHLDLGLPLGIANSGALGSHSPVLRRSVCRVLKELLQHVQWCNLPRPVHACHLGALADEQVVILLGSALELPVPALLVRRVDRVAPLLLSKRDPLSDDDEVGGLVADVTIVVLRYAKWQARLQQSRSIDLANLHALRHDRGCHPVRPRLAVQRPGDLGEEVRVQALVRIGILNVEDQLRASTSTNVCLHVLDLGHLCLFRYAVGQLERLSAPRRTHLRKRLCIPWELNAVEDALALLASVL
mmetsp:Transcript_72973/g.213817  ORF Transcript_72973/g.213817 Transcript_72973/m.213817 type:complete len:348 (+) Transcript_72973:506-1549(+)